MTQWHGPPAPMGVPFTGKRPRDVDIVYDTLDDLLLAGDFAAASVRALALAALPQCGRALLLSAMIVTRPWEHEPAVATAREALRTALGASER